MQFGVARIPAGLRWLPVRWYRSAAGGWFVAFRSRGRWSGFHIKAV